MKPLYPIRCASCGEPLLFTECEALSNAVQQDNATVRCFLCQHSYCDTAAALNLENFPDKHDLYSANPHTERISSTKLRETYLVNLRKVTDSS